MFGSRQIIQPPKARLEIFAASDEGPRAENRLCAKRRCPRAAETAVFRGENQQCLMVI